MIRLVAFDLDGTLIGRDLVISSRVKEAVRQMRALGVHGCIVTGRMFGATLPFVRELALDAPVVCYQGAAIFDPQTGAAIFERPLAASVVQELIAFARERAVHLQLYMGDRYYVHENNAQSALYAQLSGVEPIVVTSLEQKFSGQSATKALLVADPAIAQELAIALTTHFGSRAYVTRSYPEFVEILDQGVDKGRALAYVAEHCGVSLHETMAIGDSWNDRPLLETAAIGIAMGSAPQEVVDIAYAVVADVEHDGVAEALERFVLAPTLS